MPSVPAFGALWIACACLATCAQPRGGTAPADGGADRPAKVPEAAEPATVRPGDLAPLADGQRAVFWSSPEDAVPDARVDERHYVHTNERKHYLYFPYMDCAGGGYVGVGSDQNLTMIARCRAGFAWILDYDEVVVLLHAVHRAFILESPTPDEFVGRWHLDARESSMAVIEKHEAGNPRLGRIKKIFRKYRKNLLAYFEIRRQQSFRGEPVTWLSSEEDYAYVRDMYRAGRIRPMLGDLLAGAAVTGIGGAARSLGVTVRAIYMSNVEELVRWEKPFKKSMMSLPLDERSVVMRTLSSVDDYPDADSRWHYNVQSGLDFQERLGGKIKRIQALMPQRGLTEFKGLSTLGLAGKSAKGMK